MAVQEFRLQPDARWKEAVYGGPAFVTLYSGDGPDWPDDIVSIEIDWQEE